MRNRRTAALILSAGLLPANVLAQDFSGSLSLTSDYRLRGVSQDNRNGTPQAEFDWSGPESWSAGLLAAKIDFQDHEGTSVETDLFVNKRYDLGKTGLDLTVFYYGYPDHRPRGDNPRYSMFEVSAKLSRELAGIETSIMLAWSPDFFAETGPAWDAEAAAAYRITPWLSASGHIGQQWIERWDTVSDSGFPYAYADLGVTASLQHWSIDVRYEATTLSRDECLTSQGAKDWCRRSVVATLRYTL